MTLWLIEKIAEFKATFAEIGKAAGVAAGGFAEEVFE